MALDMNGPMTGAAAWMMTRRWDTAHLLLPYAMWVVPGPARMPPRPAGRRRWFLGGLA
jgi:hypothetical protein